MYWQGRSRDTTPVMSIYRDHSHGPGKYKGTLTGVTVETGLTELKRTDEPFMDE